MDEKYVIEDKQAELAKKFIEERLRSQGYSMEMLRTLPEEKAKRLMIDASIYASLKLAEVENTAHLMRNIPGI
ncbi:MAG: hypothetical protein KGJ80_09605 [Chloroflexota bacterium]|nr:hypothetical protein [Chloroflexota bacterium]